VRKRGIFYPMMALELDEKIYPHLLCNSFPLLDLLLCLLGFPLLYFLALELRDSLSALELKE
jgi:hypothetical protein